MKWVFNLLNFSIGRKQIMALTGLMLSGFIISHLSGNLLLFVGDGGETFNAYAAWLTSQPWLIPAEIGLVGVFVVHVYMALKLSMDNKNARPQDYVYKDASDASLASRTMLMSGVLVLIFLILHIKAFKFGDHHGEGGLYGLVVLKFSNPVFSSFYVLSMIVLAMHLVHGIQSIFQTFGLNSAHYSLIIKKTCMALAVAICAGFAAMPLWFLFTNGGA